MGLVLLVMTLAVLALALGVIRWSSRGKGGQSA
jgi:hypothetical protein